MRVVPVLDLLNGVVVRGVAGKRSEYRPVVSCLTNRPEPLVVARAFRSTLGLDTLYVADLDAILHQRPNWDIYRELSLDGFTLWIDAGLRDLESSEKLLTHGAESLVIGLETWPGPAPLARLCQTAGAKRVIFSLDLQAGRPLGEQAHWPAHDAEAIASQVAAAGVQRMIVLDLSHVGVSNGVGTLDLCRSLRNSHPDWELITGGGVRNGDDLVALRHAGIDGVLVASAVHDGRVMRPDIERILGG